MKIKSVLAATFIIAFTFTQASAGTSIQNATFLTPVFLTLFSALQPNALPEQFKPHQLHIHVPPREAQQNDLHKKNAGTYKAPAFKKVYAKNLQHKSKRHAR